MRKTKTLHGNAYLYEAKLKAEEKFFSKEELNKILSFYGVRVASGEWRDYAIDRDEEKSSFSIYRHTSEMPLYKIIKSHKIKKPDDKWRVLSMSGHEIKRNRSLDSVLKFLSGKRLILLKK
ncbi:DUF2794 domain-containing protein [Hyphomicrobiales bacterium]|nr:DUF2794 domain-containing protein [Hyphomicrobiales bacterium]MDB4247014.1 DUF2794 domain-containing protein [Hyphomicrobiales bacterium]